MIVWSFKILITIVLALIYSKMSKVWYGYDLGRKIVGSETTLWLQYIKPRFFGIFSYDHSGLAEQRGNHGGYGPQNVMTSKENTSRKLFCCLQEAWKYSQDAGNILLNAKTAIAPIPLKKAPTYHSVMCFSSPPPKSQHHSAGLVI